MITNFETYRQNISSALHFVNAESVDTLYNSILSGNPTVYLFGNGGSAAIAEHWVCDISKGVRLDTGIRVKAVSLSSNMPLITAIANDIGYHEIFSQQLDFIGANSDDIAIAISSSGNSKNIINGLNRAKAKGMKTFALTGFTGGEAKEIADVSIHIPSANYGVVEDTHMMILHSISQKMRYLNSLNNLLFIYFNKL